MMFLFANNVKDVRKRLYRIYCPQPALETPAELLTSYTKTRKYVPEANFTEKRAHECSSHQDAVTTYETIFNDTSSNVDLANYY